MKLIDKDALVVEIKSYKNSFCDRNGYLEDRETNGLAYDTLCELEDSIDTLEVKEVDSMIHTIIAECCDWLAVNTNLSHDEIESCRNLMLTVKDEQLKAQKGK